MGRPGEARISFQTMRRTAPLIVGAGPAGCAAAIVLAAEGVTPQLVDRNAEVPDPLCGGFMSWGTINSLVALGVDVEALGASRVSHLALFSRATTARLTLPRPAYGLSRHSLDAAMRERALALGVDLASDTIRSIARDVALGRTHEWRGDGIFLASGKHDVRGQGRPRAGDDPALGLRLRLAGNGELRRLVADAIELHLFEGGYAGIVEQERGSINICLAIRKSRLAAAGNDPHELLGQLVRDHPHFATRLHPGWEIAPIDTIGAVPYGWIAQTTEPGLFRLGDQAAVIPSLAGEGIAIAIASGVVAARSWLNGGPAAAQAYQRDFAALTHRPIALANLTGNLAQSPVASRAGLALARILPSLFNAVLRHTRIDIPPGSLALPERAV